MKKNKHSVLIIGWDGATYDVINPILKKGNMPVFQKMLDCGASGIVRSVNPPCTASAWSTFSCGMNPGSHRIFGWKKKHELDWASREPVRDEPDSKQFHGLTLWSYLSRLGKRVCVLNFPASYPAEPVNGVIVGGLLAPSSDCDFIYPYSEREIIMQKIPGYSPTIDFTLARKCEFDKYYSYIKSLFQQKVQLIKYYWKKEQWDLFSFVLMESDCFQHVFWQFMDESHPGYNIDAAKKLKGAIEEHFIQLDRLIGEIINFEDKDMTALILSDHGFGPTHYRIHMNYLLEQMDMLKVSGNKIKWNETKAYAGHTYEHCIYINLKGRDYCGVIEPGQEYEDTIHKISERLRSIRNPKNNEPVVSEIYYQTDIYSGPYAFLGPDLVYETSGGVYLHSDSIHTNDLIEDSTWQSGYHRRDGIFVFMGNKIKSGRGHIAELADFFPTICSILDVELPLYLEGSVLEGCLFK